MFVKSRTGMTPDYDDPQPAFVTPVMISSARATARTLYLREVADDPNWAGAITRIYAVMRAASPREGIRCLRSARNRD